LPVELHLSRDVGDLEQQVFDAVNDGIDQVVVAGGDGSVHEAANGIMRSSGDAALGIVPTGTGNDTAKACEVPINWEHASRLLADRIAAKGRHRHIDIGRMNGRFFANGAGVGFDARVTHIARSYRWPIGDLVYLVAIFHSMVDGIASPRLTITADGFEWDAPVTLANVANGPWVGGMFHIAPMADNSDGHFDLMIAEAVTRRRLVTLLPKVIAGTHMGQPEIRHQSVTRVNIDASDDVPSHLDGEMQPLGRHFEIELLAGALRLL